MKFSPVIDARLFVAAQSLGDRERQRFNVNLRMTKNFTDRLRRLLQGERRGAFVQAALFSDQKIQSHQAQGYMVMPSSPRSHFIVAQPDFAFGAFKTIFNPMTRSEE